VIIAVYPGEWAGLEVEVISFLYAYRQRNILEAVGYIVLTPINQV
jgi:hypothetical protein